MPEPEVIEITDHPFPFDKKLWIGVGREYPKRALEVPLGLIYYCDAKCEIPDTIKDDCFPSSHVTVKDFLGYKLPEIAFGLITVKTQNCFSKSTPEDILGSIKNWPIPSISWINKMKEHYPQAILDDMTSLINPSYPGIRMPLWTITFWIEMHRIHNIQQGWMKSTEWVKQYSRNPKSKPMESALQEAQKILEVLRWNELTEIPGADGVSTTTYSLSAYLSTNRMMNTDHINMMFSYLSERAEEDPKIDTFVAIEQLRLMQAIEKVATSKRTSTGFLKRLEGRIEQEDILAIIFPVHMLQEKHWVTMRIDFERGEISYGKTKPEQCFII